MTNNLFKDFEIPLDAPEETPEITQDDCLFKELSLLNEINKSKASGFEFFKTLRGSYLTKVRQVRLKKGVFLYICTRCGKPINNISRLVLDSNLCLVYGTDCFSRIQEKQALRQFEKEPFFKRSNKLITVQCKYCERSFLISEATLTTCQQDKQEIKCCFCCEYSQLIFKAQKCPLQKFFNK